MRNIEVGRGSDRAVFYRLFHDDQESWRGKRMRGEFRENERQDFVSLHMHSFSAVCFMGQAPALRASQLALVVKTLPPI